jgi:hypothetical protein
MSVFMASNNIRRASRAERWTGLAMLVLTASGCSPEAKVEEAADFMSTTTTSSRLSFTAEPAWDLIISGTTNYAGTNGAERIISPPSNARFGYSARLERSGNGGSSGVGRFGNSDFRGPPLPEDASAVRKQIDVNTTVDILPTVVIPAQWRMLAMCDFDGDGYNDVLWRDQYSGQVAMWLLDDGKYRGGSIFPNVALPVSPGNTAWSLIGCGQFDRNPGASAMWRNHADGSIAVWGFNADGSLDYSPTRTHFLPYKIPLDWELSDVRKLDGSATDYILWTNHTSSMVALWHMENNTYVNGLVETMPAIPLPDGTIRTARFYKTTFSELPGDELKSDKIGIYYQPADERGAYTSNEPRGTLDAAAYNRLRAASR